MKPTAIHSSVGGDQSSYLENERITLCYQNPVLKFAFPANSLTKFITKVEYWTDNSHFKEDKQDIAIDWDDNMNRTNRGLTKLLFQ